MPKEEKEHKKIKAVTEELTNPEPKIETAEAVLQTEPTEEIKENKSGIAVLPTDNISNEEVKKERGAFLKIFLVTFSATLLAFLLAGGVYVYLNGVRSGQKASASPNPVATDSPIATSTPSATVDLSSYKITVLNGNGGIGVAGALKAIIEKVGFKVSSVGNADSFDFTDTVIQSRSDVPADVIQKLQDSLKDNYSVKVGTPLDSQSAWDIVITVGSK